MANKDPRSMPEEERHARFEHLWEKLDTDKSGQLDYDEFKVFLAKFNRKEMEEKQYQFFFRGSDVDGIKAIQKKDLFKLIQALINNNQLYINKLFFRAVDEDRSGKLEASEFVEMAELNGIKGMTVEKAEKKIKKLSGGNDYLTFAQMHKALTGEELPPDTDAYCGRRKREAAAKKAAEEEAARKAAEEGGEKKEEEGVEELKEEKKENLQLQTSESPKWVVFAMIALSGFAILAMILCAAALFYSYDVINNGKVSVEAKLNSGFNPSKFSKPKESGSSIFPDYDFGDNPSESDYTKFFQNFFYLKFASFLALGLMCFIYAIVEILILVALILELGGKQLPLIKKAFYGPVVRGFVYVFISIPILGVSSDLGAASGIITCIVGIVILVFGILEAVVPKTAKVGNN